MSAYNVRNCKTRCNKYCKDEESSREPKDVMWYIRNYQNLIIFFLPLVTYGFVYLQKIIYFHKFFIPLEFLEITPVDILSSLALVITIIFGYSILVFYIKIIFKRFLTGFILASASSLLYILNYIVDGKIAIAIAVIIFLGVVIIYCICNKLKAEIFEKNLILTIFAGFMVIYTILNIFNSFAYNRVGNKDLLLTEFDNKQYKVVSFYKGNYLCHEYDPDTKCMDKKIVLIEMAGRVVGHEEMRF